MQPRKVSVAVLTGEETIRLRSDSLIQIQVDSHQFKSAAGEINVTLLKSEPSPHNDWLWCGVYSDSESAAEAMQTLKSRNVNVRLWPVGLTPGDDSERARDVRLLVEMENRSDHHQIIEAIQQVLPGVNPISLQLPAHSASGTMLIASPEGASWQSSSEVRLTGVGSVQLVGTPVGRGFHWEHAETFAFPAPLWIRVATDGRLCAGTEIDIEDYLTSVNSSEMPAESPPEFLKAQVVAARSWLLANWGSHHPGESFTVCSGDHCQCYFGPSRIRESSRKAAASTAGEVLMFDGRICDARYAKACGGVTEPAANVWPFIDEPYLGHIRDLPEAEPLSLAAEASFRDFQQSDGGADACCAPGYARLGGELARLGDLYRWCEEFTAEDLRSIIFQKSGTDPGRVRELVPLTRGPSGRLIEVKIVGSKTEICVKPELEIRRILSRTHLPSSAFRIEKMAGGGFKLYGLGWGHGVGMCQLGAAALAARGFDYRRILAHYYPSTRIEKIY